MKRVPAAVFVSSLVSCGPYSNEPPRQEHPGSPSESEPSASGGPGGASGEDVQVHSSGEHAMCLRDTKEFNDGEVFGLSGVELYESLLVEFSETMTWPDGATTRFHMERLANENAPTWFEHYSPELSGFDCLEVAFFRLGFRIWTDDGRLDEWADCSAAVYAPGEVSYQWGVQDDTLQGTLEFADYFPEANCESGEFDGDDSGCFTGALHFRLDVHPEESKGSLFIVPVWQNENIILQEW